MLCSCALLLVVANARAIEKLTPVESRDRITFVWTGSAENSRSMVVGDAFCAVEQFVGVVHRLWSPNPEE